MLANMCPGLHVGVILIHTTYLNIFAGQVHHIMAMVFSNGCGLAQQYNVLVPDTRSCEINALMGQMFGCTMGTYTMLKMWFSCYG